MDTFKSDKKVYMFYQAPYQSNADYLKAFKAHLKESEAHNGAVVFHPVLAVISLQKNIISPAKSANKECNIEMNIKVREIYPTCVLIIGSDKLR